MIELDSFEASRELHTPWKDLMYPSVCEIMEDIYWSLPPVAGTDLLKPL